MTGLSRLSICRLVVRAGAGRGVLSAAIFALALFLPIATSADDLVPSGTVTIEQVQIAFIGSGNLGGGTLVAGGQKYDFSVGGLGIGGIGISKMEAYGTVYNLRNIGDFSGSYIQARYGLAVGELSTGELWLRNSRGVVIQLKAKRTGLALSLGGDAVYIDFD